MQEAKFGCLGKQLVIQEELRPDTRGVFHSVQEAKIWLFGKTTRGSRGITEGTRGARSRIQFFEKTTTTHAIKDLPTAYRKITKTLYN